MSCCYVCNRCPTLRPSARGRATRLAEVGNLTWLQWPATSGQLYLLCGPCYQAARVTANLAVVGRSDRAWSPGFFAIAELLARLHRLLELEVQYASQAEAARQGEAEGQAEAGPVATEGEATVVGPGGRGRSRSTRPGPRSGRGRAAASSRGFARSAR